MANSSIKITDIPVANSVTLNSKFLSVDEITKRTQLITTYDLTNYIGNNSLYIANQANTTANLSFSSISSAHDKANAAFSFANTRFAIAGGTITGNVSILGDLIVSGNVTTISANNLSVSDNMIYLNSGSSNTNVDLGFTGNYNDGIYRHAGFFRDASDGVWKVFDQYVPEPDASVNIDTSNTTFRVADFQANNIYGRIDASNLTSGTISTERLGSGAANANTYLAGDGSWKEVNLFKINANTITIGTVNTSVLGSGTANANTYLAGDNVWKPIVSGATLSIDESSNSLFYIGLSDSTAGAWLEAFVSPTQFVYNTGLNRLGLGTIDPKATLHVGSNDAIIIPSGSVAERPSEAINGMLRYNTSNNYIESYSNNSWSQVGSGAGGSSYAIVRQQYTATANQVSFTVTGGYSPEELDVFYNGSKLVNGTDVNVSSGTEFVLSTGAAEGAVIEVLGLQPYTITAAESSPVRQIYSATANQTTFTVTGGYTVGQLDVYYNGVKLLNGTEVNVSSGSDFILSTGADEGASVEISGISTINYVDSVKKSGDTMTGNLIAPSFSGNGSNLTSLSVSNINASGTANSTTYLAGDGSWKEINLSNINANTITSGTVNVARLGSGTANSTTYLAGDNSWKTVQGGAAITNDTSSNTVYYIGMSSSISGAWTEAYVSNTKLYFNSNTGTLSATVFNSLSDQTLKKNIINIPNGLEVIEQIDAVEFEWIDSGQKSFGVIAQDLEKIVPELVTTEQNKTVNYSGLIAFLIKSVQELSNKVKELENK